MSTADPCRALDALGALNALADAYVASPRNRGVYPRLRVVVADDAGAWRLELVCNAWMPIVGPWPPPTLAIQTEIRDGIAGLELVCNPHRLRVSPSVPLPPVTRDLMRSLARLACVAHPRIVDLRSWTAELVARGGPRRSPRPQATTPPAEAKGEVTAPQRRNAGVSQREDTSPVALAR